MKLWRVTWTCRCCGGKWTYLASAPVMDDATSWCTYCNFGNCSRPAGEPMGQCLLGRQGREWHRPYPRRKTVAA